jgi:Tol biopolymer transport system component
MQQQRIACGRGPHTLHALVWVGLLTLSLSGCALPATTVFQGSGFPPLHQLDWGFPYYEGATWSPNGRWIALWAGPGVAQTHLVVLSPDGRAQWDLSRWGCGSDELLSTLAWLPDSSLSCITDTGTLVIGAYPFTSPTTVPVQASLDPAEKGATWTADGTAMIVASLTDPADPVHMVQNGALYRVDRSGAVALQSLTPHTLDVEDPAWAPHRMALTYLVQTGPGTYLFNLLLSPVTVGAQGALTLGPPRTLATDVDEFYGWSPSGRWIAVRHADYRGGDKIYLLNPDKPSQTVDVVSADRIGQQMMHPIWSPDGQTLIVFSVAYDASQPYSLDIGAYLRGKGLAP